MVTPRITKNPIFKLISLVFCKNATLQALRSLKFTVYMASMPHLDKGMF